MNSKKIEVLDKFTLENDYRVQEINPNDILSELM